MLCLAASEAHAEQPVPGPHWQQNKPDTHSDITTIHVWNSYLTSIGSRLRFQEPGGVALVGAKVPG